jgi:hypothetical protein
LICQSVLLIAKALAEKLNLKSLKEKDNTAPEFLKAKAVH